MARTILALSGGVLIGIFGMIAASRFGVLNHQPDAEYVRSIHSPPKMEQTVADKLRIGLMIQDREAAGSDHAEYTD